MKFTPEQIQLLLIEKVAGTIDPEDDLAVEQLLAVNSSLMDQFVTMRAKLLKAEQEGFSVNGNAAKSWLKVESGILQQEKAPFISWSGIAAMVAVMAGLVWGIHLIDIRKAAVPAVQTAAQAGKNSGVTLSLENGPSIELPVSGSGNFKLGNTAIQTHQNSASCRSIQDRPQQWSTLSVPAVLDYKITLADGTMVWMNSETTLRFPLSFPGKTREVYVKGEAYFKVSKNVHQPFIVHASQTEIRVTGTSFNVNTYDAGIIKTALVEGSVSAVSGKVGISLQRGDEAIYIKGSDGFQVKNFDQTEVLSWMKGKFYFHNTSLKELAKILTRWYGLKVRFSNPRLREKTFSGEIVKMQPVQSFIDNLSLSNKIDVDLKEGVIIFR